MIERETFGHLDIVLKAIMQNLSPFSGVSLLLVGFLQLPPVNQKGVFVIPSKRSYSSFNGWVWEKFQLHELFKIVRQSSDPDFAQLLNRVREGQQTDDDVIQTKALANNDTATWPDKFIKVYLNNYLPGQENEDCIDKLDSEVVVIKAQDGNKDVETNTCSISIPDNIGLSQTANLSAKLKLYVGARVMLTDNISVSGRLINSSVATVRHLDRRSKPLCSTIYVKFDDCKVGNSMKDRRLCGELKECDQLLLEQRGFPWRKEKVLSLLKENNFF